MLFQRTILPQIQRLDPEKDLEPPLHVPDSISVLQLLDQFQKSSTHLAVVTDEYGEVAWDCQLHNQNDELVAQYDVLTLVSKTWPMPETEQKA